MHLPSDFDDTGDPHPTSLVIRNSHSDNTINPTPDYVPNPESETVKPPSSQVQINLQAR
jgi:hypothetical protein